MLQAGDFDENTYLLHGVIFQDGWQYFDQDKNEFWQDETLSEEDDHYFIEKLFANELSTRNENKIERI